MTRSATARRRALGLLAGLVALATLTACDAYALRGRVVEGPLSHIEIVNADDPRLDGAGVPGARISALLDPTRPNRKAVGSTITGNDGEFSLPIDEPGAGFLEYEIGLEARAREHIAAARILMLPGSKKRILITLQKGSMPDGSDGAVFQAPEDLYDEIERYRE